MRRWPYAAQPSGEAANAWNFLADSSFSPSAVLGMYRPDGIQMVAPFEAASVTRHGEEAHVVDLVRCDTGMAGMPNVIIG